MSYKVGNKIGVSKDTGILDLYTKNVENTAYAGFAGSQYSLQNGNQTLGGAEIVGGFVDDANDGVNTGKHSGTYGMKYVGESSNGHNAFDIFVKKQIGEKPDPAKFYGE